MHNINAVKRDTLSLCNLRKETLMKRLDFEIVQPEYKYTRTWCRRTSWRIHFTRLRWSFATTMIRSEIKRRRWKILKITNYVWLRLGGENSIENEGNSPTTIYFSQQQQQQHATLKRATNDSVMEHRDKSVRRELLFVPRRDEGRAERKHNKWHAIPIGEFEMAGKPCSSPLVSAKVKRAENKLCTHFAYECARLVGRRFSRETA